MGGEVVAWSQAVLGGGISLGSSLWFVKWLCEFIAKRADVRTAALDAREKSLAERYDDRLRHLEHELGRTRRAVSLLMRDIAGTNPSSPALHAAAALLLPSEISGPLTDPVNTPDPEMNDALRRMS